MTQKIERSFIKDHNFNVGHKELDFADIILIFCRHLKFFIILPLLFMAISLVSIFLSKEKEYKTTTKIMSFGSDGLSQVTGLASQFGFSIPKNEKSEWSFPEIISSRTLAKKMIKRKFSTSKYGPNRSLMFIFSNGEKNEFSNEKDDIIWITTSIKNMVSIVKIKTFYELTITAMEADFARDFAIAIIEELENYQKNYNKNKSNNTRAFIEQRIEVVGEELNKAEENLKIFSDRNRRIENSPALQLDKQRLSREVQVLIGVYTTLAQQLETAKIEQVKDESKVVILDPPESPFFPSKKSISIPILLSLLFGLGIAILISFVLEYFKNIGRDQIDKFKSIKRAAYDNIIQLFFFIGKK